MQKELQFLQESKTNIQQAEQSLKNISNEFLKSEMIEKFGVSESEKIYQSLKSQEEEIKKQLEDYQAKIQDIKDKFIEQATASKGIKMMIEEGEEIKIEALMEPTGGVEEEKVEEQKQEITSEGEQLLQEYAKKSDEPPTPEELKKFEEEKKGKKSKWADQGYLWDTMFVNPTSEEELKKHKYSGLFYGRKLEVPKDEETKKLMGDFI